MGDASGVAPGANGHLDKTSPQTWWPCGGQIHQLQRTEAPDATRLPLGKDRGFSPGLRWPGPAIRTPWSAPGLGAAQPRLALPERSQLRLKTLSGGELHFPATLQKPGDIPPPRAPASLCSSCPENPAHPAVGGLLQRQWDTADSSPWGAKSWCLQ